MENFNILKTITEIISLELDSEEKNYAQIEKVSLEAIRTIKEKHVNIRIEYYNFIDDFEIRRKDSKYKTSQTEKIKKILAKDMLA